MGDRYAGGCQCGAVRYRVEAPLPPAYACHCGNCKKQTSSAFSMSLYLPSACLTVDGATAFFSVRVFSGAVKLCHFCEQCGGRLWHSSSASPDYVTLKVGTLDNSAAIAPVAHLWLSKKQAGIAIDPDAEAYQTQPADFAAWRDALARR